ncbi:hypothetical protein O3P69_000157 [Scylla paramamosain]|uniref:Uncharacterized protein n=1 Tax=Scylla paramamosain TaxID=85552 RepID=A0AAW0UVH3_SCYPA
MASTRTLKTTTSATKDLFTGWTRCCGGRKLSCCTRAFRQERAMQEKPPAAQGSFKALTKLSTHDKLHLPKTPWNSLLPLAASRSLISLSGITARFQPSVPCGVQCPQQTSVHSRPASLTYRSQPATDCGGH